MKMIIKGWDRFLRTGQPPLEVLLQEQLSGTIVAFLFTEKSKGAVQRYELF